jgi:hypothetical protein
MVFVLLLFGFDLAMLFLGAGGSLSCFSQASPLYEISHWRKLLYTLVFVEVVISILLYAFSIWFLFRFKKTGMYCILLSGVISTPIFLFSVWDYASIVFWSFPFCLFAISKVRGQFK